jgi:hypothetical protein
MIPETLSLSSAVGPTLLLCLVASLAPQEAAAPAESARLAALVGEWDGKVMFPGAPPVAGRSHVRALQGGTWIVEDFEAEMQGAPFRGHGLLGWDRSRNQYASVWVDSMEGKLTTGSGAWDEKAGALVLRAEIDMGAGPVRMRETWRLRGNDAFTFTMAPDRDGAEPVMTIEYARRK